jgi:hypothetical protein
MTEEQIRDVVQDELRLMHDQLRRRDRQRLREEICERVLTDAVIDSFVTNADAVNSRAHVNSSPFTPAQAAASAINHGLRVLRESRNA